MRNYDLTAGGSIVVTAHPVDDTMENPGSYDAGSLVWSNPDPTNGLTVEPRSDGLTALITAALTARPGVTIIPVTFANSNHTPGTDPFSITVPQRPATHLDFTFAPPA